eukprot:6157863-Amphidinium_carterae.1
MTEKPKDRLLPQFNADAQPNAMASEKSMASFAAYSGSGCTSWRTALALGSCKRIHGWASATTKVRSRSACGTKQGGYVATMNANSWSTAIAQLEVALEHERLHVVAIQEHRLKTSACQYQAKPLQKLGWKAILQPAGHLGQATPSSTGSGGGTRSA